MAPKIQVPIVGLSDASSLAVDPAGDLYIGNPNNQNPSNSQIFKFVRQGFAPFGAVNVCPAGQTTPCSTTITLIFNVAASGKLGQPQVFTQGIQWTPTAQNTEFALASGSTCTGAVTAGSTCSMNVTFSPQVSRTPHRLDTNDRRQREHIGHGSVVWLWSGPH